MRNLQKGKMESIQTKKNSSGNLESLITPLPWSYSANLSGSENHKGFSLKGFSLRARTLRIGELFPLDEVGDEGSRNAAFICKAVNCHEELVNTIRAFVNGNMHDKDVLIMARNVLTKVEGK